MPDNDKLARDIFGGSDSELSSDDDREPSPSDEEEYVEQTSKKKPSSHRRTSAGDIDNAGGGGSGRRKRKRRAVAKEKPQEINLDDLPPEQANKLRLNMQIDAALKSKRSNRPKKRKNDVALDSFADDQVARLREAMNMAADEDARANQEKLPAIAKLKLLPEAMDTLRKASLAQSIIDNNLLDAVKRWLEPLPDASLPSLRIQREFFNALKKMEYIDTAALRESNLGPLLIFYTKCKRVTPDVKKIANDLVSTWSRPIIKRSASYRDKVIPTSHEVGGSEKREKLNAIIARAKENEKDRVRKNTVAIPQSTLGDYTVAPRMNAGVMGKANGVVDADVERRRKNAERLRSLSRRVQGQGR